MSIQTRILAIRFRNGRALRDFARAWRVRTGDRLRVGGPLRDCEHAEADRGVHTFGGVFDCERAADLSNEVDGATVQRWTRSGKWVPA